MTGNEFISQLRKYLSGLPREEIEAAVGYFTEYFADAEDEAAAAASLGSPFEAAAQIIAGFGVQPAAVQPTAETVKTRGGAGRRVWLILLAAFASPLAVPVAAALVVCILAVFLVVIAALLSFWAAGAALLAAGVAGIALGIPGMFHSFAEGLFTLGCGLGFLGFGVIVCKLALLLSRKSSAGVVKGVGTATYWRRTKRRKDK